jgi:TatD DNase family protein
MSLVDSHCHIHEADYPLNRDEVLAAAHEAIVEKVICVGTDLDSSRRAAEFAMTRDNVWATLGVHPHEANRPQSSELKEVLSTITASSELARKVVGIGEIGLDYFYEHSPRRKQIDILNQQIEFALKRDLPISFHVREAFDDFWPIFDNFPAVRGVLHSYTDNKINLEKALQRGLFIGVNGIVTFQKKPEQAAVYQAIPLDKMLLETDAPFLAPVPFRGETNQPAFIPKIVEFLSQLRSETYEQIAEKTTGNAEKLFHI